MSETPLLYIHSADIKAFLGKHPVKYHREYKYLNRGNGSAADWNPPPQPPAMRVFFDLLDRRAGRLCTSEEFAEETWARWANEARDRSPNQLHGMMNRLANFYNSGIDTLHVWALCVESKKFRKAVYNAKEDVTGHRDLTFVDWFNREIPIALSMASPESDERIRRKAQWNGADYGNLCHLRMEMSWPVGQGNKRWYPLETVNKILTWPDTHTHKIADVMPSGLELRAVGSNGW